LKVPNFSRRRRKFFAPGANGIAREQAVSEGQKFAAKPTPKNEGLSTGRGI